MESGDKSFVYGIKYQARCLASVHGDGERNRFLIGTCDVNNDNEIHLVDYDEDSGEFSSVVFKHPSPIMDISSSPHSAQLFFTCSRGSSPQGTQACLYRLGDADTIQEALSAGTKNVPLEKVATVGAAEDPPGVSMIQQVVWEPKEHADRILTAESNRVRVWDVGSGGSSFLETYTLDLPKDDVPITKARWDLHNGNIIAGIQRDSIKGWDTRLPPKSNSTAFKIEAAHLLHTRDMDFNPNKPYHVATAGDDCMVKFWDYRNSQQPLKQISGHSHWVWSAKYNPFHDLLILTGGSDCLVNLQNVISVSSCPQEGSSFMNTEKLEPGSESGSEKEFYQKERPVDGLIQTYDQHEDSVYAVCWSHADPWIFSSLSYDGRFVVNTVPQEEKYKIIL